MSFTPSSEVIRRECPWMAYALGELGQTEQERGTNPEIIKYFRGIGRPGIRSDETHWCAAFSWWCLLQAYPTMTIPRNAAAARSFLRYGHSLGANATRYGGIVVFQGLVRRSESASGFHCSFYCGIDPANTNKILCLGGNQSLPGNDGCVCYKPYPKNKVRDIRWPAEVTG